MTALAAVLPPDVRDPASRLARRVVERACDEHVSNEGLKFLLRTEARKLAPSPLDEGPRPAALREPTYELVVDLMARTFPAEAHSLVYPSLRAAFDLERFAGEEAERKKFRVIDEDGVPLAGLEVQVVHGNDAVARRRTDAEGWADVTDLPGQRFVVRVPGRSVLTRAGEKRPSAPIRIELAEARRARAAASPRHALTGYLDGPVSGTPLAELRVGATDELGAETYGRPPTSYAGWIASLQCDLAKLGFYDGAIDGHYGLGTARAVLRLQEESATCACLTGLVTYHAALDGFCGAATRAEIARWFAERRRRHRAALTPSRMIQIIRSTVQILEPAGDPYAQLVADEAAGALYGIGKFSQRRGDIGELMELMFFADGAAFDRALGATSRVLMFQLAFEAEEVRLLTKLVPGWAERFQALAGVAPFRLEQEQLTRDNAFVPILDLAQEHGIVHARALALLYRSNVVAGYTPTAELATVIGPRPPGVELGRHLKTAHEKALEVKGIKEQVPHLADEIRKLSTCSGVFDDCEELAW